MPAIVIMVVDQTTQRHIREAWNL